MVDCMRTQNTVVVSSIKMRNKKGDDFSDISHLLQELLYCRSKLWIVHGERIIQYKNSINDHF